MHGSERRTDNQTDSGKQSSGTGTKLASLYSVSRQVIVQDIALIRSAGYEIISTNRGYILNSESHCVGYLKYSTQMNSWKKS